MIISSFAFSLMHLCIKSLPNIPVFELVFFRSFISLLISFTSLKSKNIPIFGVNKKILLIRGFIGSIALTLFFLTLQNIPLASAVTIQYLSPIFTALFAIWILKERMKKLQEAEEYYRECIRVFIVTCGENTPLTASAWKHLSDVLLMRNKRIEAEKYMKKAISKEIKFNPLRLNTVCELLMKLLDIQTNKETIEEKR